MADEKVNIDFEVVKVDAKLGLVFGWGMVSMVKSEDYFDTDNQTAPLNEMLKATTEFMKGERINNASHTDVDEGTVIHSFPLTPDIAKSMGIESDIYGWMVGVQPEPAALKKFESGEYTGFSIEGGAKKIVDI